MNLAPRPLFFSGAMPLAISMPEPYGVPLWAIIVGWLAIILVLSHFCRKWPEKIWPTRMLFMYLGLGLFVFACYYPWIWLVAAIQVALMGGWHLAIKLGRGDGDDDDRG